MKRLVSCAALIATQYVSASVFKLAQKNSVYEFNEVAAQCLAELVKLMISLRALAAETQLTKVPKACMASYGALALVYVLLNQLGFLLYRLADPGSVVLLKSMSSGITALLVTIAGSFQQCSSVKRNFSTDHLTFLVLQMAGIAIVNIDPCAGTSMLPAHAYAAVLCAITLSSCCSIANENLLKKFHEVSINAQNAFLYFFGFVLNAVYFLTQKPYSTFFDGFSHIAALLVLSQALFGVSVSFVLRFADSTTRTVASAVAVALLFASFGTGHPDALPAQHAQTLMACLVIFISFHLFVQKTA